MSEQWYWCLTHQQVEPAEACRAEERLGPYETREAARNWKDRHTDREEERAAQEEEHKDAWDRADEAWESWPDEDRGASRRSG